MTDIKNKKNPIAGYMGFVPTTNDKDDLQGNVLDSHIPGYVGYVPSVKS